MKTPTQKILIELHKDFNVSDGKIADKLGVSAITIYRWRLGKFKPSFAELKLLKQIINGYLAQQKGTKNARQYLD